jgi:hypothetical protein
MIDAHVWMRRQERKLGEILKRMAANGERATKKNGRPAEVSRGATHTLKDLGITQGPRRPAKAGAGQFPSSKAIACRNDGGEAISHATACSRGELRDNPREMARWQRSPSKASEPLPRR